MSWWSRTPLRRPLWDAVMAAGEQHGITACGLGARDTLRTEMGYPLHGQDISLDVTPGAGTPRVGGRLEEAGLLGSRGAAGGEGGRSPGDTARPGRAGPRDRRGPG